MERSPANAVGLVLVGPLLHQILHNLQVTVLGCNIQSCPAPLTLVRQVDIHIRLCTATANCVYVAPFGGSEQSSVRSCRILARRHSASNQVPATLLLVADDLLDLLRFSDVDGQPAYIVPYVQLGAVAQQADNNVCMS